MPVNIAVAAPFSNESAGLSIAAQQFADAIESSTGRFACTRIDTRGKSETKAVVDLDIGVHFGSPSEIIGAASQGAAWPSILKSASHFSQLVVWEADPLPRAWNAMWRDPQIDSFITPSMWMKNLVAQVTDKPVTVIPHAAERSENIQVQASSRTFTVLHLGQATPRKGLAQAVTAFIRALGPQADCKLVCKAMPASRRFRPPSEIIEESVRLNEVGRLRARVQLIDEHLNNTELANLYANSSVLLFNSSGEGFGMPAVEAMMYGLPVIYTDWSALGEICRGAASNTPLPYVMDEAESMGPFGFDPGSRWAKPYTSGVMEALESTYETWRAGGEQYIADSNARSVYAETNYGIHRLNHAVQMWVDSIARSLKS